MTLNPLNATGLASAALWLGWFCVYIGAVVLLAKAIDVGTVREQPAPPEPEPLTAPCAVLHPEPCTREATTSIGPDGWRLCDRHAAPYLTKPYDQEAS